MLRSWLCFRKACLISSTTLSDRLTAEIQRWVSDETAKVRSHSFKSETTPSRQIVSRKPPSSRPNLLDKSSLTWLPGMLRSILRPFPAKSRGVAHYTFCACFRGAPFLSTLLVIEQRVVQNMIIRDVVERRAAAGSREQQTSPRFISFRYRDLTSRTAHSSSLALRSTNTHTAWQHRRPPQLPPISASLTCCFSRRRGPPAARRRPLHDRQTATPPARRK
jgi:hypothetical protein